MNGVNVKMTISFDVKMVSKEVKKYKIMKSVYWLSLAFLVARFAKNLNNPTSSRKIESTVIEKNKTSIFIGLTVVLFVSWFHTSLTGANENAKSTEAPKRATIQYVPILILPILIWGKKRIEAVMVMNVMTEIIMVGIITTNSLLSAFLSKSVNFLLKYYSALCKRSLFKLENT